MHDQPEPRASELPRNPDYRRLRQDYPPGGETTREQGFGAPADAYPPAEQASEEFVENPTDAPGGESAPDEPDFPPPEGKLPDHERGAVTLADAARDAAHDEPTYPAPPPRTPPAFRPPDPQLSAPPEAIDTMTEERADTRDPSEELERAEEAGETAEEQGAGAAEKPRPGIPRDDTPRPAAEDREEEDIDEASIESFPASDPPARSAPKPKRA
jgi:hypothetical protein